MKSTASRLFAALILAAAVLSPARAVPVSVDLTNLRAIQTYALDKSDEPAFLLVWGIAGGKEFSDKVPKETWTVGPKKPVATAKAPVALWKGDLADGEFAAVSVTLMHGKGADAPKLKEYLSRMFAAEQKVPERALPKLDNADFKKRHDDLLNSINKLPKTDLDKLHEGLLKADQSVIKGIKKLFPRADGADHFGGHFTVLLWNNGGKVFKRVDPAGLTFGENFGTDPKIYSKLKNTRANVMMQDDAGEWSEQFVGPLSDENGLRIKMTEVELLKKGPPAEKNTSDYLVEITVMAGGKGLSWDLLGEQPGATEVHKWWDFAE